MIYISHLVLDDEMKALVNEYGTGIESIDFSISDNLDQLSDSIKTYWQKMKEIGTRDLILHGPFLDVNPCAYDSLVRVPDIQTQLEVRLVHLLINIQKKSPVIIKYIFQHDFKFCFVFHKFLPEFGDMLRPVFFFGCQGVGEKPGSLCKSCPHP